MEGYGQKYFCYICGTVNRNYRVRVRVKLGFVILD